MPTEATPVAHPRLEAADGPDDGVAVRVVRVDNAAHAVAFPERADQNLLFSLPVLLCLISKRDQSFQRTFRLSTGFEICPVNVLPVEHHEFPCPISIIG